jgi:hypothetical protein
MHMRQRNLQLALATVGVAGAIALFMPFTSNVSPMSAIVDRALQPLALPFFLTILILIASIRLAFADSLSTPESAIAFIAGGIAALYSGNWIIDVVVDQFDASTTLGDWLIFMTPIAIFVLGACLLIRDLQRRRLRAYRPVLALQTAYLGNTVFCTIGIANDFGWQAGAYLSLVTSVAYLIQIGLAYSQSRQAPATG